MPSEIAIMRAELARVCRELESVKTMFASAFDTASAGIESQARIITHEKQRADPLEAENSSLKRRLGTYTSWNSRPSENKEHGETRAKFHKNAERYEAEKRGEDPDKTVPVKKAGRQLGHEGVSRKGKPSDTLWFYGDMCTCCGRTDPSIIHIIRKRVFKGKDRRKKGEHVVVFVPSKTCEGFFESCRPRIAPSTLCRVFTSNALYYVWNHVEMSNVHVSSANYSFNHLIASSAVWNVRLSALPL